MNRFQATSTQRKAALRAVQKVESKMGAKLFGWAVRKHLTIQAAKRKMARIQREAQHELESLERSVSVR